MSIIDHAAYLLAVHLADLVPHAVVGYGDHAGDIHVHFLAQPTEEAKTRVAITFHDNLPLTISLTMTWREPPLPALPQMPPRMHIIMVFDKETGACVGFGGFHPNKAALEPEADRIRSQLAPDVRERWRVEIVVYAAVDVS